MGACVFVSWCVCVYVYVYVGGRGGEIFVCVCVCSSLGGICVVFAWRGAYVCVSGCVCECGFMCVCVCVCVKRQVKWIMTTLPNPQVYTSPLTGALISQEGSNTI